MSRIKTLQAREQPILLPYNPAPHITDWLLEIGPTVSGAMGEGPISWQDMAAWQQLTGIELLPFEARTVRHLSHTFLAQRHDARKPDCPPPYAGLKEDIVSNREMVARQLKAAFSNLTGKRKDKKRRG